MNDINKFKESISAYQDRWHSIDIRTVCFLAYEKWINLGTRIVLSEKTSTDPADHALLPAMSNFCALHVVRGIADLDEVLDHIHTGMLSISQKEIYFGMIEANEVKISPP